MVLDCDPDAIVDKAYARCFLLGKETAGERMRYIARWVTTAIWAGEDILAQQLMLRFGFGGVAKTLFSQMSAEAPQRRYTSVNVYDGDSVRCLDTVMKSMERSFRATVNIRACLRDG